METIEQLFTYHPAEHKDPKRFIEIREAAKLLGNKIEEHCIVGADRSAAIRKLRECVHTAIASIVLEDFEVKNGVQK